MRELDAGEKMSLQCNSFVECEGCGLEHRFGSRVALLYSSACPDCSSRKYLEVL